MKNKHSSNPDDQPTEPKLTPDESNMEGLQQNLVHALEFFEQLPKEEQTEIVAGLQVGTLAGSQVGKSASLQVEKSTVVKA